MGTESPLRRISLARTGGLTLAEEQFAQWAEARGLVTMFDTVHPGDDEDFEPYDVRSLCKEALCSDGRHHVWCLSVNDSTLGWRDAWDKYEDLLLQAWRVHLSEAGVEEVDET